MFFSDKLNDDDDEDDDDDEVDLSTFPLWHCSTNVQTPVSVLLPFFFLAVPPFYLLSLCFCPRISFALSSRHGSMRISDVKVRCSNLIIDLEQT